MADTATALAPDEAAFEHLEQRVLSLLAELKEARRRETLAREQVTELKEALEDKDRIIERLRSARGEAERGREAIRKRIEAILLRVEKLDKAG